MLPVVAAKCTTVSLVAIILPEPLLVSVMSLLPISVMRMALLASTAVTPEAASTPARMVPAFSILTSAAWALRKIVPPLSVASPTEVIEADAALVIIISFTAAFNVPEIAAGVLLTVALPARIIPALEITTLAPLTPSSKIALSRPAEIMPPAKLLMLMSLALVRLTALSRPALMVPELLMVELTEPVRSIALSLPAERVAPLALVSDTLSEFSKSKAKSRPAEIVPALTMVTLSLVAPNSRMPTARSEFMLMMPPDALSKVTAPPVAPSRLISIV